MTTLTRAEAELLRSAKHALDTSLPEIMRTESLDTAAKLAAIVTALRGVE